MFSATRKSKSRTRGLEAVFARNDPERNRAQGSESFRCAVRSGAMVARRKPRAASPKSVWNYGPQRDAVGAAGAAARVLLPFGTVRDRRA